MRGELARGEGDPCNRGPNAYEGGVTSSNKTFVPRPRIDARTTAWLIEQRERNRELELRLARLEGRLEASERIERAAQRYADRLEGRLESARKRESTLARAVGYLESERDQLALELGREPGKNFRLVSRRRADMQRAGRTKSLSNKG